MNEATMIRVRDLGKTFTLHHQDGIQLPVLEKISFEAAAGECLVLAGPSGAGKSTLLRCLYGNYLATQGSILIRDDASQAHSHAEPKWLEMAQAPEQRILYARRHLIAYVSQFLRVIPRVGALDVVAEPLLQRGVARNDARDQAAMLLRRLHLPERLWTLPPATFSGGEQQRVNIARGFIDKLPVMLLDEPTASLDAKNREVVTELIREACQAQRCVVGIFHDEAVRDAVATRFLSTLAEETV